MQGGTCTKVWKQDRQQVEMKSILGHYTLLWNIAEKKDKQAATSLCNIQTIVLLLITYEHLFAILYVQLFTGHAIINNYLNDVLGDPLRNWPENLQHLKFSRILTIREYDSTDYVIVCTTCKFEVQVKASRNPTLAFQCSKMTTQKLHAFSKEKH